MTKQTDMFKYTETRQAMWEYAVKIKYTPKSDKPDTPARLCHNSIYIALKNITAAYLGLGHIDKSTALYSTQGQGLTVKYEPESPGGRMDLCVQSIFNTKHNTVQVQDCTTLGSYHVSNS